MQVESVGNAPPPSGMCTLGRDLVFLASWSGDSLLVQASPEQPPPQVPFFNSVISHRISNSVTNEFSHIFWSVWTDLQNPTPP